MNHLLFPIFNRLVNPTKILGITSINSDKEFTFHNINFGSDTPFYRYEKENVNDVLNLYDDNSITLFKKGYYTVKDINPTWKEWKNWNSLMWFKGQEIVDSFYNPKRYVYFPLAYYSRLLTDIANWKHFNKVFGINYDDNIEHLIEASSRLDGYYTLDGDRYYQYFDHYTKGARFRDVISNSISIERATRERIDAKGIKVYVDIDSYHLRLINEVFDGGMPRDQRGHNWLISEVFQEGKEPPEEEQKKLIFTSLYSGNFDMLPCDWTDKLSRSLYKFKSPLGRKKIPFNYIIQEMDVLRMSKIINKLSCNESKILLYLYDGLLFDVKPNYLEDFLEVCSEVIDFPFTVKIGEEKIRINYSKKV